MCSLNIINNTLELIPKVPTENPDYKAENLILMFFVFSLIGWIWEVIYISISEKVIAKRGMLHGPWLPIYGIGGILIVLLFTPFKNRPAIIFILAALLCTVIEYITAIATERVFGCRWWDYSTKRLNLKGRICLAGGMLFGICGIIGTCYLGPVLDNILSSIDINVRVTASIILCALFFLDVFFSFLSPNKGKGITYPPIEDKTNTKQSESKE